MTEKPYIDAKKRKRAKIAEEGSHHLQIIADAETLTILNELKKRLHARRKTPKLVKLALKTFLKGSRKIR